MRARTRLLLTRIHMSLPLPDGVEVLAQRARSVAVGDLQGANPLEFEPKLGADSDVLVDEDDLDAPKRPP